MKFTGWATRLAIGLLGILALVGPAAASSGYLSSFESTYPAAKGSRIDSCSLCHTVVPTRNVYGLAYASAGHSFTAIASADSDGDGYTNSAEIAALFFPGDAADHPAATDTTAPTVTGFTLPATASSLTVTVSSFTATDAVGVTGYLLTETATAPLASAAGWTTTAPTSYTFTTAGAKTLYAWAKDAAGNVSTSRSASVTITLPDTTAPTVTAFTLPATASSLTVTVSSFTATDAVGVTGYLLTETATAPLASAAGWTTTAPTSYTFATAGAKTLYAWAKDAAGNVSTSRSASVTITLTDTTAPVVTAFTLPATASTLTVTVSTLTATDAVGVTGYLLTESATKPLAGDAGWTTVKPTSYTFATAGAKTLYAWAKDAAGNVSTSRSASVTITLADTTAPVVTAFTLPATSSSLTVTVSSFTATDAVGVTGYLLTETSTAPLATAAGWAAVKPTSYTFATAGANTLYAWAKDAANNVSTSRSASVTITLPDTTAPTVTAFTLPATSSSLTVSVTSFRATDAVGVTGYLLTEASTTPLASAAGWTATAPTSFTFSTVGFKTLYAWAKDAAGNVSTSLGASVSITLPDTTAPVVTGFTLPATSSSLTVSVTSFTATDAVGVTGYLLTETSTAPLASAAGWTAGTPTSYSFATEGAKTLYAWAKDAAGNVSTSLSASVTITVVPTFCPVTWLSLNPATISLSSASQQVTVNWTVMSGCEQMSWTATSTDPWITILTATSGTGAGSLTYAVTANTGAPRTGFVMIGSPSMPRAHLVDQASALGSPSYVLWSRADTGQAALWEVYPGSGTTIPAASAVYLGSAAGLGAPWEATSYSHVSSTEGYVLWSRSDTGQAALWRVNPSSGAVLSEAYLNSESGVGAPWQATSYTHVSSTEGYVLWTRADTGMAALWKVAPGYAASTIPIVGAAYVGSASGVGGPWQATSYSHVSATEGYVLWTRSDTGQGALWQVSPDFSTGLIPMVKAAYLYSAAGIGGPWEASGYTHVSATQGYALWTRSDTGQAALWEVSPDFTTGAIPVRSSSYLYSATGVGGPWQAASYANVDPAAADAAAADQVSGVLVRKRGDGTGTVTGVGSACGPDCIGFTVADPAAVESLKATPAAGSRFGGWQNPRGETVELSSVLEGDIVLAVFDLN